MSQRTFLSAQGLEKFFYVSAIPILALFGGYQIYKRNLTIGEVKADKIKKVEEKYVTGNDNIIKL